MENNKKKTAAGIGLTALGGFLVWKFWPRGPGEEPPVPGTATLRGYVYDKTTNQPISGIQVTMNGLSTVTTPGGFYELASVEATTYELVFSDPLGRYETLNYGAVDLPPDKVTTITVHLDLVSGIETGTLWGYVTDSATGGVVTGQSIQLYKGDVKVTFGRTDAAGRYQIDNIPEGQYTLFTESNIYEPHSESITISAGSQRKDLVLTPKAPDQGELMLEFPDSVKGRVGAIVTGVLWNYGPITITNTKLTIECSVPVTIEKGVWDDVSGTWQYFPAASQENLGTLISGEPRQLSYRITPTDYICHQWEEGYCIRKEFEDFSITLRAWGDNAPEVSKTILVDMLYVGDIEFSNFDVSVDGLTVRASIDAHLYGDYWFTTATYLFINGVPLHKYDPGITVLHNGEPSLYRGVNLGFTKYGTRDVHVDLYYTLPAPGTYQIGIGQWATEPPEFVETVVVG